MTTQEFLAELDARIAKYDLLCHPFYQAWSAGELTRDDLKEYARDYYPHVAAFPVYLAELSMRLEEGELRRAVLANLCEEKGLHDQPARAHSELWLDFAEGMGASRDMRGHEPPAEVRALVNFFHQVAQQGTSDEAVAVFYAYESQVPRVAKEKARGLQGMYGADTETTGYFTLHTTADVHHSNVWRKQLTNLVEANPSAAESALASAEAAARVLWRALDGIEQRRMMARAA